MNAADARFVQRLARLILDGRTAPRVVDVDRLRRIAYAPLERGLYGFINFDTTPYTVVLNALSDAPRQELALAHELMHIVVRDAKIPLSHEQMHTITMFMVNEIIPTLLKARAHWQRGGDTARDDRTQWPSSEFTR